MTEARLFRRLVVYISPELYKKIKAVSQDHELPMSFWCRQVLEEEIKKEEQSCPIRL